jgi:hypothetical protein
MRFTYAPARHPFRRLALSLVGAAVCVSGLTGPANAQNATTGEVKAAFLYNFARFTEWPTAAFSSAASPFLIGVSGDEVLRQTVDAVVRGKAVGGRGLKTRVVRDDKDVADIQILFVGGSSGGRVTELLKAVTGQPVLTVGDFDRFCDRGGMINFLVEDNRVRFEIRFDATEQAGLKVSSRVLTLAKAIHGKS